MSKLFLRRIFFIYFIIFFSLIACDDNYQVNLDGQGCSYAADDPVVPEDCTNYHTEDTACCYVEIENTDRTITPIISSNIAAETIVVPILEFSLPNSLRVATVTDTDVADKITP